MSRLPAVGVAGCGYWGKNLVRNFHELGSLRAIYDVDQNAADKLASQYGAEVVPSFIDLLSRSDIQGIVIAAPATEHYSLAKQALLAGKDVFVEKPLALFVEQGEELNQLAKTQNRILMVGHLLHYHPAVVELKRLLQAGGLGKVEYIYSSRLNFGKLRTEENILWSFAPHDISAILHLLDEDPVSVTATGGAYLNPQIADVTLTNCHFKSGVTAHIFVSWLHPFKEQKLVVVGDKKTAVFDDGEKDRKLVLYSHQIDWVNRTPVAKKSEGEVVSLSSEEPLRAECNHFLNCIATRTQPNTDGNNGVRVLRVLNAAEQSLKAKGEARPLQKAAAKYFVDPTARVDEPCVVGDGTHIWHYSHVMKNSVLGKNCNLGQNVHVASGVKIGNNVKIQNNVSLYTGVELEDDVFCGPSMVFTNVLTPRSHVNRRNEYQRTLIKRGASLGANSTIVCGTTVGEYAFVGAGAVVTKDVLPHALVVGCPARRIGWVCQCGITLRFSAGEAQCEGCSRTYHLDGEAISLVAPPPTVQGTSEPVTAAKSGANTKDAVSSPAPVVS
jgi:UDP-2-acetamido-3-amino-2,3-dideoxy-glucuronate N-acetyltransferase